MDPRRNLLNNRLGLIVKTPDSLSLEDITKIKVGIRNSKTGVRGVELKFNESLNFHQSAFLGANLLAWITNFFRFTKTSDALVMCQFLQEKKVFKEFGSTSLPELDPKSYYTFYEDDFDAYLKSLPPEQLKYVMSLMIGPLGVRVTNSSEPILTSKLVGWAMKRFPDIKNRTEAARFILFLSHRGYILKGDSGSSEYIVTFQSRLQTHEMPLEICGICKQFTMVLSNQPKVTLACGHNFHRHCLAELQSYEMGRCSACDAEISNITAMSELDLILPFIIKIMDSPNPNYTFRQQISNFANQFDKKFRTIPPTALPSEVLQDALRFLSEFIYKLQQQILSDFRLLQQQENGEATCLRTIKKFVLPKIYTTLFPLYMSVNKEKDLKLKESLDLIRSKNITMIQFGILPKFTLQEPAAARKMLNLSSSFSALPSPSSSPATPRAKLSSSSPNLALPTDDDTEYEPYSVALQEFDRVGDYTDVYDKLNCIVLTRHLIIDTIMAYWKAKTGTINVDDLSVTSDDLNSLLSYIIAYSHVTNIYSEFQFLNDFTDESLLNNEPGYCLVTLSTVLEYLMNVKIESLLNPAHDSSPKSDNK